MVMVSKCKVRIDSDMSEEFKVITSVRQGDRMSLLLFNIDLEDTLHNVRQMDLGISKDQCTCFRR